ncbi:uncharacterized protein LOC143880733 [Tasmannia lanceolata]|uniref:uncharacterized protein LOC143880733 n=1 Tax=Tasmannia lanceolata TaxID=3420 RepID=UPI0040642521
MKGSRVITVRGDEDLEVHAILSDPHGKPTEGASVSSSNTSYESIKQLSLYSPLSLDDIETNALNNIEQTSSDEDTDETPLEIKNLIKRRKQRRAKPLEDEFETINIGTGSLLQEIKIGKTLSPEELAELIKLDLNKASPKDDFPLPHIDILIDNTTGHALLSFMDGFSGYNQIKMAPEDKTKTTFTTQWGPYCYRVMTFGLKNAEFDITYVTQKSVKGRIIVEQLADAPTEDTELNREFPDEEIMSIRDVPSLTTWTMYFDGASNSEGKGIGIVLVSLQHDHILIFIKLEFDYTNNVAEYEACIAGLEAALSLEVQDLDVYGDSLLIICQTNGKWLTKEDRLILYHTYLTSLMKSFHNISFTYIFRLRNRFADALATLASMVDIPVRVKVCSLAIKRHVVPAQVHVVQIEARCPDGKPLYFDIRNLISGRGHTPEASLKEKRALQKLPFSVWVIDIISKISPKSSNGHEYILVTIDYFTKWIEAQSYASISSPSVSKFIRANIICRYGVPHQLISDNGSHFKKEVTSVCEEFRIKHHKSFPYWPQTNGVVGAANKNIKTILWKMTRSYKDWSSKVPLALWAYRTSVRTSTGATPYSLTYDMDAVLPIELKIPSLRILMESSSSESEWACIRHQELCMMDEKRLKAVYHVQGYQHRIERDLNKKIRIQELREGDMVLRECRASVFDPRGKFRPNWSGPYIVDEIFSGKAVRSLDQNANRILEPTNLDQLKRYYS